MSSTTLDAHCQPHLVNEREVIPFFCRYPNFVERHSEILTELSIPHPDSGQAASLLECQFTALRALKTQAPDLDFAEIVPLNDVMAVILGRLETKGGFCDDRLPSEAKDFLFGKQAKMVESVAIVGILNQSGVLALGAREADRYCPGTDTVFLEFVGSLVSATWRRVMSSSEGTK